VNLFPIADFTNDAHERCYPIYGSAVLQSGSVGPAEILGWPSSPSGETLCAVRLSGHASVRIYGKTPTAGISAASWDGDCDELTPGSASVDVYYWDHSSDTLKPLSSTGGTQVTETGYNLAGSAIDGDKLVSLSSDEWGKLIVDVEPCDITCSS